MSTLGYISKTSDALDQIPNLDSLMRMRLSMRAVELVWLDESGHPDLAEQLMAIYDAHLAELGAR